MSTLSLSVWHKVKLVEMVAHDKGLEVANGLASKWNLQGRLAPVGEGVWAWVYPGLEEYEAIEGKKPLVREGHTTTRKELRVRKPPHELSEQTILAHWRLIVREEREIAWRWHSSPYVRADRAMGIWERRY